MKSYFEGGDESVEKLLGFTTVETPKQIPEERTL